MTSTDARCKTRPYRPPVVGYDAARWVTVDGNGYVRACYPTLAELRPSVASPEPTAFLSMSQILMSRFRKEVRPEKSATCTRPPPIAALEARIRKNGRRRRRQQSPVFAPNLHDQVLLNGWACQARSVDGADDRRGETRPEK